MKQDTSSQKCWQYYHETYFYRLNSFIGKKKEKKANTIYEEKEDPTQYA